MTQSMPDKVDTGEIQLHVVENDDRRWWPYLVAIGSSVIGSVFSVLIALHAQSEGAQRGRDARADLQRQVCAVVVALDDNYHDNPPATPLGKDNATSLAQVRASLGCAPRGKE